MDRYRCAPRLSFPHVVFSLLSTTVASYCWYCELLGFAHDNVIRHQISPIFVQGDTI